MSSAMNVLTLIERAHEAIGVAYAAESAFARHRAGQLAALRAAAAVVAARSRRSRPGQAARTTGPVSLWEVLPRLAPELGEWAGHFAVVTRRLTLVESGRIGVGAREADDVLRDAEMFLAQVEVVVGLPVRVAPARLVPVRSA